MLSKTHFSGLAALPLLSILALAAGCVAGEADIDADEAAIDDTNLTFEEFEAMVPRDPETGSYTVEGDISMPTIEHLREYYENAQKNNALTIYAIDGTNVKWSALSAISLTYCVSPLFGSQYNTVVSAMNQAAADWESAAGVNFIHLSSHDTTTCTSADTGVVFNVSPVTSNDFLAKSFFPNYSRIYRILQIDGDAFTHPTFSLTGILRHELGHILGFRHEHVRLGYGVPTVDCREIDSNWNPVTAYDSASVMHYPWCGGTQTGDLVLTNLDRSGAATIYPKIF